MAIHRGKLPPARRRRELDIRARHANILAMVEKDTHIVARLAGIPLAGCRDDDHAN